MIRPEELEPREVDLNFSVRSVIGLLVFGMHATALVAYYNWGHELSWLTIYAFAVVAFSVLAFMSLRRDKHIAVNNDNLHRELIAYINSPEATAAEALERLATTRTVSRIPEKRLHFLELAGGWPGSLVAMGLFRHKTSSDKYNAFFWPIVVLHVVLFAELKTPTSVLGPESPFRQPPESSFIAPLAKVVTALLAGPRTAVAPTVGSAPAPLPSLVLHNPCEVGVSLSIVIPTETGSGTLYSYELASGDTLRTHAPETLIRSGNRTVFYYAISRNRQWQWTGENHIEQDQRLLGDFRAVSLPQSQTGADLGLRLPCDATPVYPMQP
jgi:uncharacterized membrane protein YsdA (DUF1294 family)